MRAARQPPPSQPLLLVPLAGLTIEPRRAHSIIELGVNLSLPLAIVSCVCECARAAVGAVAFQQAPQANNSRQAAARSFGNCNAHTFGRLAMSYELGEGAP